MKEAHTGLINMRFQNPRICKTKIFHREKLRRSHKGNQNDIRLLKTILDTRSQKSLQNPKGNCIIKEEFYIQLNYQSNMQVKIKTLSDVQSLQSFASAVPFFHEATARYALEEDRVVLRRGEKKIKIGATRGISRVVLIVADKGRALSKKEWN